MLFSLRRRINAIVSALRYHEEANLFIFGQSASVNHARHGVPGIPVLLKRSTHPNALELG